jgi:hypothetical protein
MTVVQSTCPLLEEFAEMLADGAGRERILAFRASEQTAERAGELLRKDRDGSLTADERHELDMFQHTELLLRLVKARLRVADQT